MMSIPGKYVRGYSIDTGALKRMSSRRMDSGNSQLASTLRRMRS